PFMVASSPAIPINVSGTPPLQASFMWQTNCSHIRKSPHQMLLKAIDNGPQVNLANFKTVNIKVIAPAPQNLTSNPVKNSIALEWEPYACSNAKEIHIYKKSGNSLFNPDICETGIPSSTGFELLTKVNTSDTSYLDDGTITPVHHGRQYCYRIVAVFYDGAESIASNETCAAIANDAPMITQVDISQTSENEGKIFVAWLSPPEIDTVNFPGPNYEYRVLRATNDKTNFEYITSTYSLFDTSFLDNALNTKEIQYYYKIEFWGENKIGTKEHIETSDPASSIFLTMVETDKQLKLKWIDDVPWENNLHIIYRFNEATQLFDYIAATTEQQYEDSDLTNEMEYCYYVKSVGQYLLPDTVAPLYNRSQVQCGTPYDNVPPETPETKIETDCKNVTFSWKFSNEESYLDVYQYYIYYQPNYKTPLFCIDSFYSSASCLSWCPHIIQNLPSITGCYAMLIKDEKGNYSEMTSKLCFDADQCVSYSLPNVFTPDGDEYNELWRPFPYSNVEKIALDVHDRWGKRVFRTEDPDIKWDGKDQHTHRPLPEGTYYYGCDVFLYTLEGVKKRFLNGVVVILRDSRAKQNY
ncbi:MAG: gliding motility-associated C-terminal domain-containing protein, partial [Lentimicrobiaceae bacterium]|nr:gliding motility-associated C-terminal domain-containing protein [Lentimicrobiaceae bacterium]